MSDKFILGGPDGRTALPCDDLIAWARWFETAERRVAYTTVGDATVSTVFLGLDHSFGNDAPLLFETLVIGGTLADEVDRYSTWGAAEAGHAAMCARVRATQTPVTAH